MRKFVAPTLWGSLGFLLLNIPGLIIALVLYFGIKNTRTVTITKK